MTATDPGGCQCAAGRRPRGPESRKRWEVAVWETPEACAAETKFWTWNSAVCVPASAP